MIKSLQIQVSPETSTKIHLLKINVSNLLKIDKKSITHIEIKKKSIDARQKIIKINLTIEVYINEEFVIPNNIDFNFKSVKNSNHVNIIGAGPAGLFAALTLIENGIKPILYERGKNVKNRRRDLANITKEHIVNVDSNYCFGEGGAGTYSDGKLYTRSKKRGDVNRILDILVNHGANPDVKINAHPHIGTNKLPKIIENIRNTILECGGEIHFNTRVVDIKVKEKKINKLELKNGDIIDCKKLILATGHSARDIFEILDRNNILIESKSFALGVRVEHSQKLIDQIQYKCNERGDYLPPAPYSIARQVNGRGVYSFCMCPGGIIAPCATNPGEVVTNGWSPSKRNGPHSNSGIVVELKDNDFKEFEDKGALAAMFFQKKIEQKACKIAGGSQKVPAQRLLDFLDGKVSTSLPKTSYMPGLVSVDLNLIFPKFIIDNLKEGFKLFGKQMKGYLTNDAVIHAPESRTSSPVRIPRDYKTLEHIEISGLYPCGEGAGYAGGIVSAAIDGQKCAIKCVESFKML
jgi:hypothetical protein